MSKFSKSPEPLHTIIFESFLLVAEDGACKSEFLNDFSRQFGWGGRPGNPLEKAMKPQRTKTVSFCITTENFQTHDSKSPKEDLHHETKIIIATHKKTTFSPLFLKLACIQFLEEVSDPVRAYIPWPLLKSVSVTNITPTRSIHLDTGADIIVCVWRFQVIYCESADVQSACESWKELFGRKMKPSAVWVICSRETSSSSGTFHGQHQSPARCWFVNQLCEHCSRLSWVMLLVFIRCHWAVWLVCLGLFHLYTTLIHRVCTHNVWWSSQAARIFCVWLVLCRKRKIYQTSKTQTFWSTR